jgi:hypothetical protein
MQIHEFCASSALMIWQAAGRNACLPGWLRLRRAAGSLMNPELGKCIVNQPG